MSRVDDVKRVIQEFFNKQDMMEFDIFDIDFLARDLAQAIVNNLPSCTCNGPDVYPPLWKVEE